MTTTVDPQKLKREITGTLDHLSPQNLQLLHEFTAYLQQKSKTEEKHFAKLGGLWAGYTFSSDEIDQARKEIWATLGQDANG